MDSEIIKTIVEFNTNPNNQRIKNYYRKDNIWNLFKKSRSKEAHSAFIAQLLSIKEKDDVIYAFETKKAKYEQIKQGMIQQLLTGKIRLIDQHKTYEQTCHHRKRI